MKFSGFEETVIDILKDEDGNYISSYQIFYEIMERNNVLAQEIMNAYSGNSGTREMGSGFGGRYSPATYISQGLNRLIKKLDY